MDLPLFLRSIDALTPWLRRITALSLPGADAAALQAAGLEAEAAMFRATGGVNTHKGALFSFSVLLAALANGFSISLFKRYAEGEDTLTLCGYQFIVGGGLLLLTGLCFGGTLPHFTGQSLLLLGYMVLLSAVAQTIWSALTRYNPVGRVAVYGFLNPVFGVLLSALLLREGQQAFTPYSLAALVLVCVGIFVVNRSDAPGRGAQADQQP